MEAIGDFIVGLAAGKPWLPVVVVLLLAVSEALPFVAKVPANGILDGFVGLLKAIKAKILPGK